MTVLKVYKLFNLLDAHIYWFLLTALSSFLANTVVNLLTLHWPPGISGSTPPSTPKLQGLLVCVSISPGSLTLSHPQVTQFRLPGFKSLLKCHLPVSSLIYIFKVARPITKPYPSFLVCYSPWTYHFHHLMSNVFHIFTFYFIIMFPSNRNNIKARNFVYFVNCCFPQTRSSWLIALG